MARMQSRPDTNAYEQSLPVFQTRLGNNIDVKSQSMSGISTNGQSQYDVGMFAYPFVRAMVKPVQWICIPATVLHPERLDIDGPCILAPTHVSHLEPFVLSLVLKDRVSWMARSEFYKIPLSTLFMNSIGAFPVRRRGYPRAALRAGMRQLDRGERVGVFPEGGVSRRQYSVMRGGPVKRGACFLALHKQVPIIPIAVTGTHAMNRFPTWLPFHNAPVQIAIGTPIQPGPCPQRLSAKRQRRIELGEELRVAYQQLYQELLALPGVDDRHDLHPNEPDDADRIRIDPDTAAGCAVNQQSRGAVAPHAAPKPSRIHV